jgi:hypothetical protein
MASRTRQDLASIVTMHDQFNSATGLVSEIDRLRSTCAHLEAERSRLTTQLAKVAEDNEALRASAILWRSLYDRQVARANALAEAIR